MKKTLALTLALTLTLSLAGCAAPASSTPKPAGSTPAASTASSSAPAAKDGKVYYLNFKPEQADKWVALAEKYTAETGVPVTVSTAAAGTYEQTLKSEIAKTDAPTLFQVNGPVGLANWKDYCYDLAGSPVYSELKSDDFALKDGETVYGIAYVIETYGIIYNKTIMDKYIAMEGAKIKDIKELNSFDMLKAVAEDMQAKKADLGINGAFTSAGMDASSDWRFKTHLANLPVAYEYKADGVADTEAIKGTYLENYKNIWDLYINNSTCEPGLLSSKTGDDALSEFVMSEAVFFQNGTWAYGDIQKDGSLSDEEIGMLPIYIGAPDEANQGLCTGSENYWCVNNKAKPEDIQATLDFMNWCVTSETGKTALSKDMSFVCPFKGFTGDFLPANPLIVADEAYQKEGKLPVAWCFTTMPSEEWKNVLGGALLEYAQGTGDWTAVEKAFVENWASEKTLAKK